MTQILPQFGNAAFTIAFFVLALSIIVAIHEYGHYIVGRWTGIHAEVFSLGFGPVLFARTDRHGTRWQVAALPFGGYVKFLGDANAASVGSTEVGARDKRRTMLGAPLWARSATVVAGPVFNFILSLLIFAGVILAQGKPTEPLTVAGLPPLPPSYAVELQAGDEIIAIAGVPVLMPEPGLFSFDGIPAGQTLDYDIRRDGQVMTVQGPNPYAPVISGLSPGSAAYDIDLRAGDVVMAIDEAPISRFEDIVTAIRESDGRAVVLDVWRAGETLEFVLQPRRVDTPLADGGFETRWLIGITGGFIIETQTEMPSPFAAIWQAMQQVWFIITSSLSGLWYMITGAISSCNLSGPVGIAQASGAMASQGATSFIWFVAVLSTAVGLLNLFPIPVLDGGHLVFFAYEAVTGKLPGDKALRLLMAVGLSLILTLMVFALANDLFLCP